MITLFSNKNNCCGCGGCKNICPKDAISMHEDSYGFIYPMINSKKCIECGLCHKVCAYQNIEETNNPHSVYAAESKNKIQLKKSSSGGIFAALATLVINKGGIVYGAIMERTEGMFIIKHKGITSMEDLSLLQGSKYVQSNIGDCYKEIHSHLASGQIVLFSGTPCQCAGLKGYLRTDHSNLITIDIICHGVPNQKFFNDYINYSFSDLTNISGFTFRDKTKGWGLHGCIDYGNNLHKTIIPATNSYYWLFLNAQTYRESCYSCKYASSHRPGDITIGDYWGIQKEHPELISSCKLDTRNGISCIITNTTKGDEIIAEASNMISIFPSTYKKVANHNKQLIQPSQKGNHRQIILDTYQSEGYYGVDKLYKKIYRYKRYLYTVFNMMPYTIQSFLKRMKS